jgi:hypothetical protein
MAFEVEEELEVVVPKAVLELGLPAHAGRHVPKATSSTITAR